MGAKWLTPNGFSRVPDSETAAPPALSPPSLAQSASDPAGSTGHGGALVGPDGGSPAALAALTAAIDFAGQALAPATLRAYRADWQHFCAWCRAAGWAAMPAAPATVAAYLASLAKTHTSSALVRRLAALSRAHRLARQPWPAGDPAIRNTLRGIQRKFGRPVRQAAALATEEVHPPGRNLRKHAGRPARPRAAAARLCRRAAPLRTVAIEYEHITFDNGRAPAADPARQG